MNDKFAIDVQVIEITHKTSGRRHFLTRYPGERWTLKTGSGALEALANILDKSPSPLVQAAIDRVETAGQVVTILTEHLPKLQKGFFHEPAYNIVVC